MSHLSLSFLTHQSYERGGTFARARPIPDVRSTINIEYRRAYKPHARWRAVPSTGRRGLLFTSQSTQEERPAPERCASPQQHPRHPLDAGLGNTPPTAPWRGYEAHVFKAP